MSDYWSWKYVGVIEAGEEMFCRTVKREADWPEIKGVFTFKLRFTKRNPLEGIVRF